MLNKREDHSYEIVTRHLRISDDSLEFSLSLNASLIKSALKAMKDNYPNKELSLFESSMLSVKEEEFKVFLSKLKHYINSELSKIETTGGDLIVIANTQIFPYRSLGKKESK
jgi:hypothetical protein